MTIECAFFGSLGKNAQPKTSASGARVRPGRHRGGWHMASMKPATIKPKVNGNARKKRYDPAVIAAEAFMKTLTEGQIREMVRNLLIEKIESVTHPIIPAPF